MCRCLLELTGIWQRHEMEVERRTLGTLVRRVRLYAMVPQPSFGTQVIDTAGGHLLRSPICEHRQTIIQPMLDDTAREYAEKLLYSSTSERAVRGRGYSLLNIDS